jgi:pantothenate kinase
MPENTHTWPAFEHGVGDPVGHALVIPSDVKLIIVEGLYLLHRAHGWQLTGLLDECWYLDTPMEVAMQRLVNRHMAAWGLSPEQASARLDTNDRLNADIVVQTRGLADRLIHQVDLN